MSHGFDQEIVREFLTESGELLQQFEADLVALEATPADPELLNRAFRALHTIKGSASFLALTNLVTIAHAAESALNAARNGDVTVDRPMMDLLLRAVDSLKTHLAQLDRGTPLDEPDPEVVASLAAIGEGRQLQHEPAQATHPSTPPASTDPHSARPLVLGAAKADLLGFLITDLDETMARIRECLGRLTAEAGFSTPAAVSAAGELAEHAVAIERNAEFFEFGLMGELARLLGRAAAAAPTLPAEAHAQVCPRLGVVAAALDYLGEGLRQSSLRSLDLGLLPQRLEAWLNENDVDPSSRLASECDARAAALADGVSLEAVAGAAHSAAPSTPHEPMASTPAAVQAQSSTPRPSTAAAHAVSTTNSAAGIVNAATAPAAEDARTAATKPAATDAAQRATPAENTIRVEVGRLEALMNLVGELVLQKNRVGGIARRMVAHGTPDTDMLRQLGVAAATLDRVTADLQTAVMRTRMQPLEKLFGRYPRLIRDLSARTGKQIRLVLEGGETEVDKSVIEDLGDPLVHLLRNACDHGLESPSERVAAGKDPTGTITLRAMQEGGSVRVVIDDDGRGLSRERIGSKAVERGLVSADTLQTLADREVYRFIFEPGFSTAEQVSDLSGRGVGMDVVRTNVEKLKGSIDLASRQGLGASVSISIPLTVAVLPAMLVGVGNEIYAVPLASILEIVRPSADQLKSIGGSSVMRLRESVLPLISASQVLGSRANPASTAATIEPFVVVLSASDRRAGLTVTRVIGQQEVVVKALDGCGATMTDRTAVSGATVRDDGGVSLIVDVAEIVRAADTRLERVAA